mmetsp:Transcript_73731/g.124238  ORF Transcript_73731/g.124238 Transcript_73731/m.124238 type:complete len:90 (+) Transcript_73731:584-853(+)
MLRLGEPICALSASASDVDVHADTAVAVYEVGSRIRGGSSLHALSSDSFGPSDVPMEGVDTFGPSEVAKGCDEERKALAGYALGGSDPE